MAENRLLVFGDIHGAIGSLRRALARAQLRDDDTLIFLGDYIDRGEDSRAVLDFLIDLEIRYSCIFLKGNHEDMFLRALPPAAAEDDAFQLWRGNGGWTTLRDFGDSLPQEPYASWLRRLRLFHETETHYFVHAGLRPGVPPAQSTDSDRIWIREPFLSSSYDWGKRVVFGHTIFLNGPLVQPNKIGLDTGAFLRGRGKLSCLILPDNRFVFSHGRGRAVR